MKLFQKKVYLIEALQFVPENFEEFEKLFGISLSSVFGVSELHIETSGDPLRLTPGDWLIQEPAGCYRICTDEIFRHLYEIAS